MKRMLMAGLLAGALLPGTSGAVDMKIYDSTDPIGRFHVMSVEGGLTRQLTVGLGSGAHRRPDDPDNRIYVVSDRGPNFTCRAMKKVTGIEGETVCKGRKLRLYPFPDYSPSIYVLHLTDDGYAIKDVISLKTADGAPITGLTNPLTHARTEVPATLDGTVLAQSAAAIDAEGIVRLSDGTYWIGEESAPSVLHVAADGRIFKRLVPAGTENDFADAGYPVYGTLPRVLYKRKTNRGIESMAVSPDESKLYTILQNPLVNPEPSPTVNWRVNPPSTDMTWNRPIGSVLS